MRLVRHKLSPMIDNLSDPALLFALVLAFVLGYRLRDSERSALSPNLMTKEEAAEAVGHVTISRWIEIDAGIDVRRKIAARKMRKRSMGLGQKESEEAIEAGMASRGMTRR